MPKAEIWLDHKLPTRALLNSEELAETRGLLVSAGKASKVPTDTDFERFLVSAATKSDSLLERLASGDLTPREWADEFKVLLNDGHASAWILGRRRAGDLSEATDDDLLTGVAYGDTQADFLLGFMEDLLGGRYTDEDGEYKVSQIRTRANMYINLMRGTSGAAFVSSSEPEEEFEWKMGAVELHCTDCPDLAEASPWVEDELFAFPGDGNTACLSNCKCTLVRSSDGRTSFEPVTL